MAQIALFISRALGLYSFLIWMRILMSWINPYAQPGTLTYYVAAMVDPYLNMFRSRKFHIGMLDFSPVLGIGVLTVVQSVFEIYGTIGRMSLSLILSLFVSAFWSYGVQLFFTLGFIMLVLKTIASFMRPSNFTYTVSNLSQMFDPMEEKIGRMFFRRSIPKRSTLNVITLLLFTAAYFVARYIFGFIALMVARIPF